MKTHELHFLSQSEEQTNLLGANLAHALKNDSSVFIQLEGGLGAGKTAFARGFINTWLNLKNQEPPDAIVSPTYNIVKTYGSSALLAHLDLYRVKSFSELEHLGFEQYFFDANCCIVEWLSQIPEALKSRPSYSIEIQFKPSTHTDSSREITIRSPKTISLKL